MAEQYKKSERDKLTEDVGTVPWHALNPLTKGGSLILLAPTLDVVDVAMAIADDNTERVRTWLDEGLIHKPDSEEVATLSEVEGTPFRFIIVQPFVIAQAVLS